MKRPVCLRPSSNGVTALHRLRQAALRLGLDVRRAHAGGPAAILNGRGVDLVLDVGANRGQYGDDLRRAGYQGRICSFEPLPSAYGALARRASRDPLWDVHEIALGDRDRTAGLNVAANAGTSSSVLPMRERHLRAAPESRYLDTIDVPMRRLATIWAEIVPPACAPFLKLDVQGFEGAVLDGAADHLNELTGLQLEVSLVPLYEGAPTLREILDRTESLGMALAHVEPGFADPNTGELLQMDVLFVRASG